MNKLCAVMQVFRKDRLDFADSSLTIKENKRIGIYLSLILLYLIHFKLFNLIGKESKKLRQKGITIQLVFDFS